MFALVAPLRDADPLFLGVLGVAGLAVASLVLALRYVLSPPRKDIVEDRLRRAVTQNPAENDPFHAPREGRDAGASALAPIARVAQPTNEEELGRLRAKLAQGGVRSERAVAQFLAAKVLLGFGVAGVFLTLNAMWPLEFLHAAFFTIASMALGFYLPTFWLRSRIQERQKEINKSLPNALDLLVTCVEAGLGLEAAINRVADEIKLTSPTLAQEFQQTAFEMRAGSGRGDAFKRLAERTGLDDLHSLSAVISQTQIFGTSIADSLRVQSESMRIRRMNLAEERAAAAGVKMTIPLVLFITPSLFAVLLGPAVVQIFREFIQGVGNG